LDPKEVLRTEGLTKRFGGMAAVSDVNLSVKLGTCHAVVGPNGAGKSTLFNLICGVLAPTSGRVFVAGKEITGYPSYKVAQLGVGRSFQVLSIFSNLTVLENVRIAAQSVGGAMVSLNPFSSAYSKKRFVEMAYEVLGIVGLISKSLVLASTLTPSDKRKLDMAIALVRKPKILLLDEPTGGVSIEEIPSVIQAIRAVRAEWNPTLLLIEHKMDVIEGLADCVTVMDRGAVIAEGTTGEIERNERVQEVYLGRKV
jgi:branched-chain amino acid transport system ATP-binding protein